MNGSSPAVSESSSSDLPSETTRGGVLSSRNKSLLTSRRPEGRRFGTVPAREQSATVAALILKVYAGDNFFHHGRFAGAAEGEIADGDDLDAQGGIPQNPHVVEKAAGLDRDDEEDFGENVQKSAAEATPGIPVVARI